MSTTWRSNYFFGKEVSDYGKKNNRIDYATLTSAFQHVLNNDILYATAGGWDDWNIENGELFDDDDNEREIFQFFIIDENGADILKDYTDEIVMYNSYLDMYVWGVTHFGTSWDYVLTDIQIELDK